MKSLIFNLADLSLDKLSDDSGINIKKKKNVKGLSHVAIIGMSGKVGLTENLEEFWEMLLQEKEGYATISEQRKREIIEYLKCRGADLPISEDRYISGTHLPEIADFDHKFFSISLQEAKGMDPNQRIFLETAWEALEDAGYSSETIKDNDVGVFVGVSSDFGVTYRDYLQVVDPTAPEITVAGNIKSMIASRLAYQLDLKGPAMLFDTACSSGLVAAYNAFRYIQNGECSMAVVGGVKCDILPISADKETGIGIKDIQDTSNSDGHTKTFDNNCEGTSTAEGAFAFVFKDLDKAIQDGDQIHAVIIGGAVNQDGASNGITAPNADAQSTLIQKAIKDAKIDVNQISYIEAHGTATKLGDPIEISGIQKAFSKSTSRKQFCGIGSVKTNIGHMDNVSGLAGLAKIVLCMKNHILPASLNFEQPNKNIEFLNSPVYVNSTTMPWSDKGEIVYAGINSFGLSGTNCHLILKSADVYQMIDENNNDGKGQYLLPLSAKNVSSLKILVQRYITLLTKRQVNLKNMVFTASVGRMHLNVRAGFIFSSQEELLNLFRRFLKDNIQDCHDAIFFNEFRVVSEKRDKVRSIDITEQEKNTISEKCVTLIQEEKTQELSQFADFYIQGADVPWSLLYNRENVRRISLPTYPFEKTRCWVEPSKDRDTKYGILYKEELVDSYMRLECINSLKVDKFWELNEHRIQNLSVLPGTGLIEMIIESAEKFNLLNGPFLLKDILFEAPVSVSDNEEKKVHVIFNKVDGNYQIQIVSKTQGGHWEENAQAVLLMEEKSAILGNLINLNAIKNQLLVDVPEEMSLDAKKGLLISDRWSKSFVEGNTNDDMTEFLLEFQLPQKYESEIEVYFIHPALLDAVINAMNNIVDKNILFLPFSYGSMKVYGKLKSHVFAHFIKRKEVVNEKMHSFDVKITDVHGNVLIDVENYRIKSADNIVLSDASMYGYKKTYKKIMSNTIDISLDNNKSGKVLLVGEFPQQYRAMEREFSNKGYECVVVDARNLDPDVFKDLNEQEFEFALFAYCPDRDDYDCADSWNDSILRPVQTGLQFIKEITKHKLHFKYGVTLMTQDAFKATEEQTKVNPGQAGLVGLGRVAALEYSDLKLRCMDVNENVPIDVLIHEISSEKKNDFILYRNTEQYEETIEKSPIHLTEAGFSINSDGVVIISGGTGELGTEVASFLAKNNIKKLVLLGSKNKNHNNEQLRKLQGICDVFEVDAVNIDDYNEVNDLVNNIREKYGKIAGVLHLAGKAGDGFIYKKSIDDFMKVYQPKALGALNLHVATLQDDIEFFVEFSSISGLDYNVGQSDYTAANMVLDSLAEYRRENSMAAVSIQWPAWREIGIAQRMNAVNEEEEFLPMDTDEAIRVLAQIMRTKTIPPVIMPGLKKKSINRDKGAIVKAERNIGRRNVKLYGLENPDEIDMAVAEIWAETLDIEEIDINDDFEELGGNSLLTSQMLKQYEKRFQGMLDITDLFKYTTISKQTEYLKQRLGYQTEEKEDEQQALNIEAPYDLEELLNQLEKGTISVEDTKKYLDTRGDIYG